MKAKTAKINNVKIAVSASVELPQVTRDEVKVVSTTPTVIVTIQTIVNDSVSKQTEVKFLKKSEVSTEPIVTITDKATGSVVVDEKQ